MPPPRRGPLGLVAPASASQLIARNASSVKLGVNAKGTAMVTYSVRGKVTHLLASGAVNARHRPGSSKIRQIHFKLDYSGGWKHRKLVWKTFKDACHPYDGPELAWFVAGCKAADGSYWALQSWQTRLPDLGLTPWLPPRRPGGSTSPTGPAIPPSSTPTPTGSTTAAARNCSAGTPRRARSRLQDDRLRDPDGIRAHPLPRHLQLLLRPRLAP